MNNRNYRSSAKHKNIAKDLIEAQIASCAPSFIGEQRRKLSGAKAHGMRYERKVQRYLTCLCKGSYVPAPWLRYRMHGQPLWKYCQPDGLILDFNNNLITIIEIKLNHTAEAWLQVRRLYEPITRFIFGPQWDYAACEVVSWYDPSTQFPERLHYISELCLIQAGQFGLYIVREKILNDPAGRHTPTKRRRR